MLHQNETGVPTWLHDAKAAPTPAPTPTPNLVQRVETELPHVYTQAPQATPKPTPNPQIAQERRQRYNAALASEIEVKFGDNTRVLPSALDGKHDETIASLEPAGNYTLLPGYWISAVLSEGIDSDHPGDCWAKVAEDVYDSATHTALLIPRGTTVRGHQDGRNTVEMNDTSLLSTWDLLIYPNGAEKPLPKLEAIDGQGYAGLAGHVDKHRAATWGPATLIAFITGGTMLASGTTYGGYGGFSGPQMAFGGVANSLGSHAQSNLMSDLSALKPTLTIAKGTPFRIVINHDVKFDAPYRP